MSSLRVAIVDDDPLFRDSVSYLLGSRQSVAVIQAGNSSELVRLLDEKPIDCILLDYDLGGETGLAVGDLIQKRYRDPPPIVMLTGQGSERTAVKAFRTGFSDYVSKRNLSPDELMGAIRRVVEAKEQERSTRRESDEFARLAAVDGVTGLPSRRYVDERIDRLVRSTSPSAGFAVVMIELDHLGAITTKFGLPFTDRLLRAFSARFRSAVGSADSCGRFGEFSFICLVEGVAKPKPLAHFCEELSAKLSLPFKVEHISLNLAPVLAVAMWPKDGHSPDQLYAAASRALKEARQSEATTESASDSFLTTEPHHTSVSESKRTGSISAPTAEPTDDRRKERRQRVLKRGQVVTAGLDTTVDCTVRDQSADGARLRLDHYFAPPDRFDLRLIETGIIRPVVVRWQVGTDLGIEFVE